MPRPLPHHRQRGASLIVAIVFLLLLGTLALTGLRASTTNVTIVGNMQARQEVSATAQMLIEQTVSSDEFARNPQGVLQAARVESDFNGDGGRRLDRDVRRGAALPACAQRLVPRPRSFESHRRTVLCQRGAFESRARPVRRRAGRVAVRGYRVATERALHRCAHRRRDHPEPGRQPEDGCNRTHDGVPMTSISRQDFARQLALALSALTLAVVSAAWTGSVRADDIDIYSMPNIEGFRPNVLIMLDNTANWSA